MSDDGATKVDDSKSLNECLERYKHQWIWVWENGVWLNQKVCTTCGDKVDVALAFRHVA
jgi:hypothetical protein